MDSGTTSHICTARDSFNKFYPVTNTTIQGVGNDPISAQGQHGTVNLKFNFDRKSYQHQFWDFMCQTHPTAYYQSANSTRWVELQNGEFILKDKRNSIVGKGHKNNQLYLLAAKGYSTWPGTGELCLTQKLLWDQWHRCYGHISTKALEKLDLEKLVQGLAVPFPQEAEHCSEMPGERIMSDMW